MRPRSAIPIHNALADAGPGLIELWELAEADDKQDIEGWRAPFDGVPLTSPEVKLRGASRPRSSGWSRAAP